MNEDKLKFVKKSIGTRRRIVEIWPEKVSLLYTLTILSYSFLKILKMKSIKRDFQIKMIFSLRSDLSKQLKNSKDWLLNMINEEVTELFN